MNDCFYVFLDVDGVLNKESDWKIKYSVDEDCVRILGEIRRYALKSYKEVRVVLTSTWRAGLARDGSSLDTRQLQSLERCLDKEDIKIYGSTPVSGKPRQEEIEYYIKRNRVEHYLVLDDDPHLFPDPKSINLYIPDYRLGLTRIDGKKICDIIKNGEKRRG
ncbi:MAG: hypothetical protein K5853_06665 [Lachnospiraceae bacterium]|nr:hypothetical protein [Lachnospiraceae bacterium]